MSVLITLWCYARAYLASWGWAKGISHPHAWYEGLAWVVDEPNNPEAGSTFHCTDKGSWIEPCEWDVKLLARFTSQRTLDSVEKRLHYS